MWLKRSWAVNIGSKMMPPNQTQNASFYKRLVHGFWSFDVQNHLNPVHFIIVMLMFKIIMNPFFNLLLWCCCSKSLWIRFFQFIIVALMFKIIMNPVQCIIVALMFKTIMNPFQCIIVALMLKICCNIIYEAMKWIYPPTGFVGGCYKRVNICADDGEKKSVDWRKLFRTTSFLIFSWTNVAFLLGICWTDLIIGRFFNEIKEVRKTAVAFFPHCFLTHSSWWFPSTCFSFWASNVFHFFLPSYIIIWDW